MSIAERPKRVFADRLPKGQRRKHLGGGTQATPEYIAWHNRLLSFVGTKNGLNRTQAVELAWKEFAIAHGFDEPQPMR